MFLKILPNGFAGSWMVVSSPWPTLFNYPYRLTHEILLCAGLCCKWALFLLWNWVHSAFSSGLRSRIELHLLSPRETNLAKQMTMKTASDNLLSESYTSTSHSRFFKIMHWNQFPESGPTTPVGREVAETWWFLDIWKNRLSLKMYSCWVVAKNLQESAIPVAWEIF